MKNICSRARSLALVVALSISVFSALGDGRPIDAPGGAGAASEATPAYGLGTDELTELTAQVVETLGEGSVASAPGLSERGDAWKGPVYAALRADGEALGSAWSAWAPGSTVLDAVAAAVASTMDGVDSESRRRVDAVELCLSHSYRTIDVGGEGWELLTNVHRGVLGIEIDYKGHVGRYSPTLMLARNWSFELAVARFAKSEDMTPEELLRSGARVRVFGCDQVLVVLEPEPRASVMERGNTLVTLSDVSEEGVGELAALLGGWLTRQVHEDGRMTYKYWPSRSEESASNNMIRQWMATIALNRLAKHRGDDPAIYDLATQTIRYNLDNFYSVENGLGLVLEPDGEVKLGAVALAALAIATNSETGAFGAEEAALRRTVDELWNADGSFQSFLRPAGRNDNQNFYPGEALLLWAELYAESHDPALLDRIMASFRYYRGWHRDEANRNPAFVPWHTQAYYLVWQETGDAELREFIFEMNDWLLGVQQWDSAEYPDLQGRFYDPDRASFGPPHASSTGVFLEGLIDAYALATETGDVERMDRYRLAIRRGLRSVMQLQFKDEVDLYYVRDRDAVLGGVRETVYRNEIRVDSVQHNLMAVLKALEIFSPEDFV